jgi:prephenate dehydrogenase
MSALYRKLGIVGLGLLGGSVAGAAKERGLAEEVFGAARRRGPLEGALARGLVDAIGDAEEAVTGADLVVLATPVSKMSGLLQALSPKLSPGTLVTDVGSVKGVLGEQLPGLLPEGVDYVGSHPMAGSHLAGVEHARTDLFEGACCVVTPTQGVPPRVTEKLMNFWRQLGARVVRREPEDHDKEAAWVSHAPHLLAFAFAHALGRAPAA